MEHKSGPLSSSRESAFTSPISVTKPVVLAGGVVFASPKESPASTTPLIEISASRLTKLTHRTTDRKSDFLKTLKDDRNGDFSDSREGKKLEDLEDNSTPEPKENERKAVIRMVSLSLEKEMATHSSILAWTIPWTEEPGGLQSTGSQRVGHD